MHPEIVLSEEVAAEFATLAKYEVLGRTIRTKQLPGWREAWTPMSTLTEYALDFTSEDGQHKAAMFRDQLGMGLEDAGFLREQVLEAFPEAEATFYGNKGYGPCWTVPIVVVGSAVEAVRSLKTGWIIEYRDPRPKLVTLFPERSALNRQLRRLDGRLSPAARMARDAAALRGAPPAA
jgi:hypothetical protein